jgi:hypothetical protein
MIDPNGPLPPSVYWRRRAVAAVALVFAVALLAWIVGGLVAADDQHPVRSAVRPPTSARHTTSARTSAPSSSPGPGVPSGSVTASPKPVESPVAPTTTPAPPPAGPPAPCPDAVLKVAAAPDAPSYPVGTRPLLRLLVVNGGPVPCTRDVSRNLREIFVLAQDGTRLWSSNDCYGPPEQDVRVLPAGQPVEFTVHWAGRTSAPGCPLARRAVTAGTYQVVGRLGAVVGPPAPLTLT